MDMSVRVAVSADLCRECVRNGAEAFDHEPVPDLRSFYDSRFALGQEEYRLRKNA